MRVRIIRTPVEDELDGMKLDGFLPGMLVDVTPALAWWLIAQDYAVVEMRQSSRHERPDEASAMYAKDDDRHRF